MSKILLRDFPSEDRHGPWPLLKPLPEDLHYMPATQPPQAPQPQRPKQSQRLQQAQSRPSFLVDFASIFLKGIIVGLFAFGLTYSFLPLQSFWLSNWHWAYLIGGVVLLIILIGLDITFMIVLVASIILSTWLNWKMIVAHPLILLLFIGGGVVVMIIREFIP